MSSHPVSCLPSSLPGFRPPHQLCLFYPDLVVLASMVSPIGTLCAPLSPPPERMGWISLEGLPSEPCFSSDLMKPPLPYRPVMLPPHRWWQVKYKHIHMKTCLLPKPQEGEGGSALLHWAWALGNSGLRVHGHSIVRAWGGGPCWWASSGLPVLPTHLPQGCLPPKAALTERPQPPPCIYSWGSGLAGTECVHKGLGIPEPPHAFQGLRFGCFVWSEPGWWAQRALNSIVGGHLWACGRAASPRD